MIEPGVFMTMRYDDVLVSFCVKCFNQEAYIKDAVEGAVKQTYRPLEIVISDDASTDGSVSVIRDVLSKHGAVKCGIDVEQSLSNEHYVLNDINVCLLINKKNHGNSGNWQVLCEHTHGKLLIKADGDDISLPERAEAVVRAWKRAGEKCGVLYHNAIKIDSDGNEIGTADKEVFRNRQSLGAVMACVRECVDRFGGCEIGRAYDDFIYDCRARFLGLSECRFDEKLVKYRMGSGSSTVGYSYTKTLGRNLHIVYDSLECILDDLEFIRKEIAVEEYEKFRGQYANMKDALEVEFPLWESASFTCRIKSFLRVHKRPELSKVFLIHVLLLLPHRFSKALLDRMYRGLSHM